VLPLAAGPRSVEELKAREQQLGTRSHDRQSIPTKRLGETTLATLRCGERDLPLTFTNEFLAHLQVAVHRRFAHAGGFFVTGTYPDGKGNNATVSHWLSSATALVFTYDVADESGELIGPVELNQKEIDAMLEAMDRPVGVHLTSEVWLPFRDRA
jgi:hypothetical protein